MKSSSETSVFKRPLGISKKKPELMPPVGEYDQSINTIAGQLQKKKERFASNPILANIRLNRGNEDTKNTTGMKKNEEYDKYLGPGCYELAREFDKNLMDIKGNPLISKVRVSIVIKNRIRDLDTKKN